MDQLTPSVSVLMAVYSLDDPSHFADALDSLLPFVRRLDAVVLVADGPLTPELETVIEQRILKLKIIATTYFAWMLTIYADQSAWTRFFSVLLKILGSM
jgi:hypothetical protein